MAIFAAIDTETSGLPDDPDARVVEVGVAIFDSSQDEEQPIRTFTSLVRPEILTDDGRAVIAMVSKIPEAELLSAPTPAEIWPWLLGFLGNIPVRAYNEEFDREMLERTFPEARWGLSWGPSCGDNLVGWRKFPSCIMEAFCERFSMYSRMREDLSGPYAFKLAVAASILGLPEPSRLHRAVDDATLAGQIALLLDAGVVPPEMEIVAKISARVDAGLPVFHAALAAILPTFRASSGPLLSTFRPAALEEKLPTISLRRDK